jgi:hypothetical protein
MGIALFTKELRLWFTSVRSLPNAKPYVSNPAERGQEKLGEAL